MVVMGHVRGPYGIRGWLRVQAYTEYLDSLADYDSWWLLLEGAWQEFPVAETAVHGKFLDVKLAGVNDRSRAEAFKGCQIGIPEAALPEPEEDEYYWRDLIGLTVENLDGHTLGRVKELLESGAHDLLVVESDPDRLIPFVAPIVRQVLLEEGRIIVDWGLDY